MTDFFELMVASKSQVARETWAFTFVAADGSPLPAFTPGAHLTVGTPPGVRRNYSLCGDPADPTAIEIAVKRDASRTRRFDQHGR